VSDVRRLTDVVAVGEALVDLVAPDALDLASAARFIRAPGGAPANVACAVARLGGRSAFVGAVGDDPFGGMLRQTLRHFGVELDGLRVLPEARTTMALVASGGSGPPDFVFYRGADAALSADDVAEDAIADAAFVHVSSMALLAEPARGATLRAIELARGYGARVSLDPNIRLSSWPSAEAARAALQPVIAAADVLKVNCDEAEILTGEAKAESALESLGRADALAIVTLGEEGCLWRRGADRGRVSGFPVNVVETTGAGDAFAGALLFQLARHQEAFERLAVDELEDCLQFASSAAAITCTAPGAMAALPTHDQVVALLHTRPARHP
jgi:sugar/nucleoside kinase (ribokinase family)